MLFVDDDASFREVTRFNLEEAGYAATLAARGEEALALFEAEPFPVVATDLKMPGMGGMELLKALLRREPETLVIVITAFGDMATAVEAMKAGAFDFLPKPCGRDQLRLTVGRAMEHAGLRREVRDLRARLGSGEKPLVFRSKKMEEAVALADRAAPADVTVLIRGESGVGKELLARRIHRLSQRSGGPFVAVNCGAIPRDLLEDELFGHVRGAFTGASRDRRGRFVQADGGTLFLDEAAELPPDLQTRLLRVLQERVVDVIGQEKPVPVDVRILAATNRDLEEAVRAGRFREDLYFRLNVLPLRIPPLRERREDILPLADLFLKAHGGNNRRTFSAEAVRRLEAHPWRGNVRELENLCQRLLLISTESPIGAKTVAAALDAPPAAQVSPLSIDLPPGGASLVELEKAIIRRALEMNNYNQSRSARFLRIPRHVLLYRIEKYGLGRPEEA